MDKETILRELEETSNRKQSGEEKQEITNKAAKLRAERLEFATQYFLECYITTQEEASRLADEWVDYIEECRSNPRMSGRYGSIQGFAEAKSLIRVGPKKHYIPKNEQD